MQASFCFSQFGVDALNLTLKEETQGYFILASSFIT